MSQHGPSQYKAVVFDLYGTLIDLYTPEQIAHVFDYMSVPLGVPADSLGRAWGKTYPERVTGEYPDASAYIQAVCKSIGVTPSADGVKQAVELMAAFSRDLMKVRPDAESTFRTLKEAGLKIALLTNCSWFEPPLWNATPLAPLTDVAVFSYQVGCKKPDPRIYDITCERLDVSASECIFVGDGGNQELEAAQAVGMLAVMIRTPEDNVYNARREASNDWPGLRISRLKETLAIADLGLRISD